MLNFYRAHNVSKRLSKHLFSACQCPRGGARNDAKSSASIIHELSDYFQINSSFFRAFQAEHEQIMRHKWLQSEKAGCDLGEDWAIIDWVMKHRAKWKQSL